MSEDLNYIADKIPSDEEFIQSMEIKKRKENKKVLGIIVFIIFAIVIAYYLK